MRDTQKELGDLVVRARAGDDEAIRQIVEEWGPTLRRVIRRRLAKPTRAAHGSQDFTQDVWKSFFAHIIHERTDLTDEQMLRFLGIVARNKVVEANRRILGRAQGGPRQFVSLDGPDAPPEDALVSPDPSSEEVRIYEEEWDEILRVAPPHSTGIVKLLRAGYTSAEIAAATGLSERTVSRVLAATIRMCRRQLSRA